MTSTPGFAIAAALLVALLAGSGGLSGGGVTYRALHGALKAAVWMPVNGVPDYPEPG